MENQRIFISCVPFPCFMKTVFYLCMFSKDKVIFCSCLHLSFSYIHLTHISSQQNLEYIYFENVLSVACKLFSRVYYTFRGTYYTSFTYSMCFNEITEVLVIKRARFVPPHKNCQAGMWCHTLQSMPTLRWQHCVLLNFFCS